MKIVMAAVLALAATEAPAARWDTETRTEAPDVLDNDQFTKHEYEVLLTQGKNSVLVLFSCMKLMRPDGSSVGPPLDHDVSFTTLDRKPLSSTEVTFGGRATWVTMKFDDDPSYRVAATVKADLVAQISIPDDSKEFKRKLSKAEKLIVRLMLAGGEDRTTTFDLDPQETTRNLRYLEPCRS